LIHGADLISIVDKKFARVKSLKEKRTVYTLMSAVAAIRKYVGLHPDAHVVWDQFFELLAFDALIGGTDRHYYNWGVLQNADTTKFIRLAPAFDNGVSLLWKLEEYGPQFLSNPWTHEFAARAKTMLKKDGGGKYTLHGVLEALYQMGDYEGSTIAGDILARLHAVNPERIASTILKNVPQSAEFKTGEKELKVVSSYAMDRLELLKGVLMKISKTP